MSKETAKVLLYLLIIPMFVLSNPIINGLHQWLIDGLPQIPTGLLYIVSFALICLLELLVIFIFSRVVLRRWSSSAHNGK